MLSHHANLSANQMQAQSQINPHMHMQTQMNQYSQGNYYQNQGLHFNNQAMGLPNMGAVSSGMNHQMGQNYSQSAMHNGNMMADQHVYQNGMGVHHMGGMQTNMGNMYQDMNLLDPMGNDKRTYRKKKTWCMNLKIQIETPELQNRLDEQFEIEIGSNQRLKILH
jgi:hypothetical protein